MKGLLIFCLVVLSSCKSISFDNASIQDAVQSIHFLEILNNHSEKQNIVLYDDTKNNILEKDYGFYKSFNGSQINFKKIDFEFNVNFHQPPKKGIILYNSTTTRRYKLYYFVDAETKLAIQLGVKKNKEVDLVDIGNF